MAKNDNIIPQRMTEDLEYLSKGVHLVKIINVEENLDKDNNPVVDKNDNPSLKISMKDRDDRLFIDRIYYGSKKVQWVLDGLMKALGVDNSEGSISKNEVIGKTVFVALEEVTYIDGEGNQLYKNNGEAKIFIGRYRYFKVLDVDVPPTINEEMLNRKMVDKSFAQAAPAPVEAKPAEEATVPSTKQDQPDTPWTNKADVQEEAPEVSTQSNSPKGELKTDAF